MHRFVVVLMGLMASCASYDMQARVAGASMCAAALAGDEITTVEITHTPYLHESNPVLGGHPSNIAVITYFGVFLGLDVAINVVAPLWLAMAWDAGCTGVESYYIAHNLDSLMGGR